MKYNSIINLFSIFRYRSRSPAYHSNSNYRGNSDYRDDYRDDRRDDYRGGRDSHRDSHRRDYDHDGRDRGRGRGRGRGNCKNFLELFKDIPDNDIPLLMIRIEETSKNEFGRVWTSLDEF